MPSLPPPREPNILTPEQAERLGDLIEQQIGRYYVLVGNRSLTQHPGDQATYVLKVAFAAGGPS